MGSRRNGDEFAELFPHLRCQLRAVLVAGYGPDAGYQAARDVLTYARHHWVTIRHRHDLVLHLYRLGRRMAKRHTMRWDGDPVSTALASLTVGERVAIILRYGYGWPFDEITEVSGESVAAIHRHHDHGLAKAAAVLAAAMRHDAPREIAEWVDEINELLPEIMLDEIDARPAPHAVPVSGWRRFSAALASILTGVLLALAIGWVGWQLVRAGDRALDRMMGPDAVTTAVVTTVGAVPATMTPQPDVTWTMYGPLDGMPVGKVIALAGGPDGAVWVATTADGRVSVTRRTRDGWVGVDAGLEGLEEATPRWLSVAGDRSAWMAVATADGRERLVGFDGDTWTSAVDIDLWGSVASQGRYGQLWVAALDSRMRPTRLERVQGRWIVAHAETGFPLARVESIGNVAPEILSMRITFDEEGVAWFAADGEIVKFDGHRTGQIESIDDSWVAVGPHGDVWIPTEHGLRQYADGVWTYHDARHGLPGIAPVAGSLRFAESTAWVAFRSGSALQAYVYDGATWAEAGAAPAGSGLQFEPGYDPRIAYTPGRLGGADDPVWIRASGTWFRLAGPDAEALHRISDVCRTPDGTLWIASDGVLRSLVVEG